VAPLKFLPSQPWPSGVVDVGALFAQLEIPNFRQK
jgi:hypothetical protein